MLTTDLEQQFVFGIPIIISPHLKGGIPQYDIVDGERVENGRIHIMKVDGQLLVSEELYEEIKGGSIC